MTRIVYGYPIAWAGPTILTMPRGARVVLVGVQGNNMMLWAEVDTDRESEDRTFAVYGTGHPVPEDATHVGSTQNGGFVWHIYEHGGAA